MEETAIWEQHTVTLHRVSSAAVNHGAQLRMSAAPDTMGESSCQEAEERGELSSALLTIRIA